MVVTIAILLALTLALAAFVLAPRMAEGRVVFDATPDRPSPFGFKMAWIAIRTRDTGRIIDVLGLVEPQPCNWRSGIGTVYDDRLGESHVFVSPPVNGWSFVVGLALPYPVGRSFVDKCTPMLLDLGAEFIEVQYFFTYPLIDFFAWARIIDGKLVRAFAIGDEGIIWNKGKPSKDEKSLGLKLFELRGVRGRKGDAGGELILYPTEEHVMRLASRWSLDPVRIDAVAASAATGFIASAPLAWRPERMRKSA
ncbi:MAG: hypothetical protein KJZ80_14155 [Hyphomicrobiaceae bacterium]|nr:hypothetical protein [Hyphomicrobiaceae bacterium]